MAELPEPNDSDREPNQIIDLSPLHPEVHGYVLDQLPDRLRGEHGERALQTLLGDVGIVRDYQQGAIEVYQSVVAIVAEEAAREKLAHIEREVEAGERGDFSISEIEDMRAHLDSLGSDEASPPIAVWDGDIDPHTDGEN